MGNVTATARIGSRVIRIVGESSEAQLSVTFQLDLMLEHVRRQNRSTSARLPQLAGAGKRRVEIY